jgi:uncharacterized 2Fe-2S/4Fe-4S cluster protein (DUF4445 family)
VLLARAGIDADQVGEVVITGSFGVTLAPAGLKSVGIITENMVRTSRFVREGALAGVEKALCSPGGSAAVAGLAASLKVVPLSGTPVFEQQFLAQLDFPAC